MAVYTRYAHTLVLITSTDQIEFTHILQFLVPGTGPWSMMTSWNGNIFRVIDPLCGEFTDHRWIPFAKAIDAGLCFFLWLRSHREAGDLRRHRAHYDVIVMGMGNIRRYETTANTTKREANAGLNMLDIAKYFDTMDHGLLLKLVTLWYKEYWTYKGLSHICILYFLNAHQWNSWCGMPLLTTHSKCY